MMMRDRLEADISLLATTKFNLRVSADARETVAAVQRPGIGFERSTVSQLGA